MDPPGLLIGDQQSYPFVFGSAPPYLAGHRRRLAVRWISSNSWQPRQHATPNAGPRHHVLRQLWPVGGVDIVTTIASQLVGGITAPTDQPGVPGGLRAAAEQAPSAGAGRAAVAPAAVVRPREWGRARQRPPPERRRAGRREGSVDPRRDRQQDRGRRRDGQRRALGGS